jgi:hypothetical protein
MRPMTRLAMAAVLILSLAAAAVTFASQRSAAAMVAMSAAAGKWLESLTPEQRDRAVFAFDSDERLRWHYVPTETFPRKGLAIKEMSEPQRAHAHALLKTGLSARGYLAATTIMELEKVLRAIERSGRINRDQEGYLLTVFGTPGDRQAWGWRFEGHHLSVRFDLVNAKTTASSPAFFGANPAEVRDGPQKGVRALGVHEDAARALMDSLDEPRRATAIVQTDVPNEMLTGNALTVDPLSPIGIKASAMTKAQRDRLMALIDVYVGLMAPDVAADRMDRLKKAGIDNIAFAWAGDTGKGKRHYYRLQGPTFLVEYDNAQNNGNHIHSVWRDFNGDFGRDLLREHLKSQPH